MSNKINYAPRLPSLFKELGMNHYERFFLIDVGASSGIDERWNAFGEKLEAIGFEEFINDTNAVSCVEWPEKAGSLIPGDAFRVQLKITGMDKRTITITMPDGGYCDH